MLMDTKQSKLHFTAWEDISQDLKHDHAIELFDIQSKKVIYCKIYNGETINLGSLMSGIYLYDIYTKGVRQSGKLIKE